MSTIDDLISATAPLPLDTDGRPAVADRTRVALTLRQAGFTILRQGRFGVSIAGPAALYERVLGLVGPYAGTYEVTDEALAKDVPTLELYPPANPLQDLF